MKTISTPVRAFVVLLILAGSAAAAIAQAPTGLGSAVGQADVYLKVVGDQTGSPFSARCGIDELLAGMELRAGDDIDAIRPLCVTAYGPRETSAASLTTGSGLTTQNRSLPYGIEVPVQVVETGWHGGSGGHLTNVMCPGHQPVVTGITVRVEGVDIISVNNIHLFCGEAATFQSYSSREPSSRFDAPMLGQPEYTTSSTQHCPAGQVSVGIHGRSGIYLDALGLICGAPRLSAKPVRPQGRVRYQEPVKPQARVRVPVDLVALHARGAAIASTDPEVAALRNQQRDGPARRGFDIGIAAAEGQTAPGPGKQRIHDALSPAEQGAFDTAVSFSLERNRQRLAESGEEPPDLTPDPLAICANARVARARNSPAAPGLEAQCIAAGGTLPKPAEPPICGNARRARARNSPAAPGLEAQCRAAGGTP